MAKKIELIKKVVFWIILAICTLWIIHPLVWMVLSSIRPEGEIFSRGLTLPSKISLDAYYWVLGLKELMDPNNPFRGTAGSFNFYRYILNGAVPGIITAIIVAITTLFAGYSLARFSQRGVQALGTLYLSMQFLPAILMFVPLYLFFYTLRLIDTWAGLILLYVIGSLPWATWMMRSFIVSIPIELEESAMIDGCSRVQAIWRITMRLCAPGFVAVFLFTFTSAWNAYLPGLIISTTDASKPIAVGLAEMLGWYGRAYWGGIMAASTLTTIPVAIIFVYLQKWLIKGLTAGAIKA